MQMIALLMLWGSHWRFSFQNNYAFVCVDRISAFVDFSLCHFLQPFSNTNESQGDLSWCVKYICMEGCICGWTKCIQGCWWLESYFQLTCLCPCMFVFYLLCFLSAFWKVKYGHCCVHRTHLCFLCRSLNIIHIAVLQCWISHFLDNMTEDWICFHSAIILHFDMLLICCFLIARYRLFL